MSSYLVTLAEAAAVTDVEEFAGILGVPVIEALNPEHTRQIIVQCCPAHFRSYVDDEVLTDPDIGLHDPVVVGIDIWTARHFPILEPAGE